MYDWKKGELLCVLAQIRTQPAARLKNKSRNDLLEPSWHFIGSFLVLLCGNFVELGTLENKKKIVIQISYIIFTLISSNANMDTASIWVAQKKWPKQ